MALVAAGDEHVVVGQHRQVQERARVLHRRHLTNVGVRYRHVQHVGVRARSLRRGTRTSGGARPQDLARLVHHGGAGVGDGRVDRRPRPVARVEDLDVGRVRERTDLHDPSVRQHEHVRVQRDVVRGGRQRGPGVRTGVIHLRNLLCDAAGASRRRQDPAVGELRRRRVPAQVVHRCGLRPGVRRRVVHVGVDRPVRRLTVLVTAQGHDPAVRQDRLPRAEQVARRRLLRERPRVRIEDVRAGTILEEQHLRRIRDENRMLHDPQRRGVVHRRAPLTGRGTRVRTGRGRGGRRGAGRRGRRRRRSRRRRRGGGRWRVGSGCPERGELHHPRQTRSSVSPSRHSCPRRSQTDPRRCPRSQCRSPPAG